MLTRFQSLRQVYPGVMRTNSTIGERKYAIYHVEKPDIRSSTHEQAKSNPILGPITKTYQHSNISRGTCKINNCEHKLCENPCSPIIQQSYVGHGTHNGNFPQAKYLSKTDFNGDVKPQYGVMYDKPIENSHSLDIDQSKTLELNTNNEMKTNIHMNSSRLPMQKLDTGTDDPTSIN